MRYPNLGRRAGNLGLAMGFLVLCGLLIESHRTDTHQRQDDFRLAGSREAVETLSALRSLALEVEAGSQRFLLSGLDRELVAYREALAAIPGRLDRLAGLVGEDAGQVADATRLRSLVSQWLSVVAAVVVARREGRTGTALEVVLSERSRRGTEELRQFLESMEARERSRLAELVRVSLDRHEGRQTLLARFLAGFLALGGVLSGTLLLNFQLSARERAQRSLLQSDNLLRAVSEGTRDIVFVKDLEGRYRMINSAGAEFLDRPVEDIAGRRDAELFPYDYATRVSAMDQRVLASGGTLTYEENLQGAGDPRFFHVTKGVYRDRDGKVMGLVGIARDVTERKARERELEDLNARLGLSMRHLERRTTEVGALSEMGNLLHSCVSVEEAYPILAASLGRLFPQHRGVVAMTQPSRSLVRVVSGWGGRVSGEEVFGPDDCWALRRGRPHHVAAAGEGPVCRHVGVVPPGGSLCVPMVAQGEALGVIHLEVRPGEVGEGEEGGRLGDLEVRLAVGATEQIGLALGGLYLRERLLDQSNRDPLTGAFNRRFMEDTLRRELLRAERRHTPLGLVLLDLDHFKSFNDRFGHAAGDLVLRELVVFLERHLRGEDVICRLGGEEFVLVLPDSPLERTMRRADSLGRALRGVTLRHDGQSLPAVTVSMGVAAFPDHASTAEALLAAADGALYGAKAAGRDCVEAAPVQGASAPQPGTGGQPGHPTVGVGTPALAPTPGPASVRQTASGPPDRVTA